MYPSLQHSSLTPILPTLDEFIPYSIPPEERLVFTGPWHCELDVKSSVEIISEISPTGELGFMPTSCVSSCVTGVFLPTANMSEIPNLPVLDGAESITTFTHDENPTSYSVAIDVAVANEEPIDTVGKTSKSISDVRLPYDATAEAPSSVPVATPILSALPGSSSLLLSHTLHLYVFDTLPLLSVVDMSYCDLCPCDNLPCLSFGPEGFNCVQECGDGIYHTALVRCASCYTTHTGFLGDVCSGCGTLLYGQLVICSGLPGQNLLDFTDTDDVEPSRNISCSSAYFTGRDFLPLHSIHCAPVQPFHSSLCAANFSISCLLESSEMEEDLIVTTRCDDDIDDFSDALDIAFIGKDDDAADVFVDALDTVFPSDDDDTGMVFFNAMAVPVPHVNACEPNVAAPPACKPIGIVSLLVLAFLTSWKWMVHVCFSFLGLQLHNACWFVRDITTTLSFWSFFVSMLLWDTFELLHSSSPHQSLRRH